MLAVFFCLPRPLPTADGVTGRHWWAPLGGLAGAFAVIAGLTITANSLMSLVIDQSGLFGTEQHSFGLPRVLGGALMVAGVALIALF